MRKVKGVLYSKYMPVFTKKKYYNDITDNLICSKSCHLVSCLKESMIYDFIDEFLKRYYTKNESRDRIPKFVNYYKNYLKFFCRPIFRDLELNDIIQSYGEKCAEIYYNDNYGKSKKDKDKKKTISNELKTIFTDTIRESINNNSGIANENSIMSNNTLQLNQSIVTNDNNLLSDDVSFTNSKFIVEIVNDLNSNSKRIQLFAKPIEIALETKVKIELNSKLKYKLRNPTIHIKNSKSTQIPKPLLTDTNTTHKKNFSKISIDLIKIAHPSGLKTSRKITSTKVMIPNKDNVKTFRASTISNITQTQTSCSSQIEIKKNKTNKGLSRNAHPLSNAIGEYNTEGIVSPSKSKIKLQKPIYSSFSSFDKQQQLLNMHKMPVIKNNYSDRISHNNFGSLGVGIGVISNVNSNVFRSTLNNLNTTSKKKKSTRKSNVTNTAVPLYKIMKHNNGGTIKLK